MPGTPSSISRAPMRTIGSGSERPCCAKRMVAGESHRFERAGAGKGRRCGRLQLPLGIAASAGRSRPHGMPRRSSESPCGLARTIVDRRGGPLGRFVFVTIVAGVGRPKLSREVGTGNAEAVIVALVDHHEGPRRHVAETQADRRGSRPRDGCAWRSCTFGWWHWMQTSSPERSSLALCGSWQLLQVTPAANILLCLNEP